MEKSFIQKLIRLLSIIIIISGLAYLLIYPLIQNFFQKEKPEESGEIKVDKNMFKKIDSLIDNSVNLEENFDIRKNPFNPL